MEKIRRVYDGEQLAQYLALLEEGLTIPLVVTGNSMSPFLVHERDTVSLSPVTRKLRRGDILFYQRTNGAYILHRVWRVSADGFTMVGDGQRELEPGIRQEQVLAVVTSCVRKGKTEQPGTFWWDFFEKFWIRAVPLRRIFRKAYGLLAKIKN